MDNSTTARVDLQRLQILNDRLCQTLEALNQVRMSAHHMSGHQGMYGYGNPYASAFWGAPMFNTGWPQTFGTWGNPHFGFTPSMPGFGMPNYGAPGFTGVGATAPTTAFGGMRPTPFAQPAMW